VVAHVSRDILGERWVLDSIGLLANETSVMIRDGASGLEGTGSFDMDAALSVGRTSSGGDVGNGGNSSCASSI
jgi:hypothetical protein